MSQPSSLSRPTSEAASDRRIDTGTPRRSPAYVPVMRALALTLTAGFIVTACAGPGKGGDNGAPGQGAKRAKKITLAVSSDEGTLTPYTQSSGYPGSNLVALVYDKLFEHDAKNRPQPLLAEKVEVNADNTTFTVPLRSSVKWHDGKPFTPEDVVFSVGYYKKNTLADGATPVEGIKEVTARGGSVQFRLKSPDPEFVNRVLADMRILPRHIWSAIKKPDAVTAEQAVGTGP